MQKLRTAELLDIGERIQQHVEVMTVDRADVVEAEFLEQRTRRHHALHVLFGALGELADRRCDGQHFFTGTAGGRIKPARHQARQVVVQGANVGRDRHVVVVQHHQERQVGGAGVVERLEGHAGGHRAVADDRHGALVGSQLVESLGHAECGRDRGAGMAGAEGIEFALGTARKSGDAAGLAQAGHRVAAAGENLVGVTLVADIPHDAVVRGVEHVMQRQGQFHRAQVRGQMTTGMGDRVHQEFPQFGRQLRQLGGRERAQVGRGMNGVEQRCGHVRTSARPRSRPAGATVRRVRQVCPARHGRRRAVPAPARAHVQHRAG